MGQPDDGDVTTDSGNEGSQEDEIDTDELSLSSSETDSDKAPSIDSEEER